MFFIQKCFDRFFFLAKFSLESLIYSTLISKLLFNFLFFQFSNPDFSTSISETVDSAIQNCPIDVRRGLYKVREKGSSFLKDILTLVLTLLYLFCISNILLRCRWNKHVKIIFCFDISLRCSLILRVFSAFSIMLFLFNCLF